MNHKATDFGHRSVRLLTRFLLVVAAVLVLYGASWTFARGGRRYFSPETLESHYQREILLPFTDLPLYRSRRAPDRYKLVEYLIDEGYWTPVKSTRPPIQTNHWNLQWRDGHSDLERQFSWKADEWIEWTQANPEMADALWPDVLQVLRFDPNGGEWLASYLMQCARFSSSLEEFEENLMNFEPEYASELVALGLRPRERN